MDNVAIFKALGEPTRLRILRLLLKTGKEACGCELVDSILTPQYNLTKHIDVLMAAGLIKSRKEGRWVYYSACPDCSPFCVSICKVIQEAEEKIYQADLGRFKKRLSIREEGKCLLGIQNKKFTT
ncbi:MAG: helix-turn-helix transcriptional regulator [Candidatus Omnitrophica bacterium]|nr:helix-turn-helix transcriptional regulator [Candidatus Omnitrophota bacterium]